MDLQLSWRRRLFALGLTVTSSLVSVGARAEKVLAHEDNWEVFTDGRVGVFLSYVNGDGYPRPAPDANGNSHDLQGGGLDAVSEREAVGTSGQATQGKIENMRMRSGFISNWVGLGARYKEGDYTYSSYFQIWAYVESEARQKNRPNPADVRQGYAKVEAPWGSVLAGRTRCLFSRGATDIDVNYAHRYGVGFPGGLDSFGPSSGQIGFGVLGSGFASGVIYATPVLGGFQANVGLFDPIRLQNGAVWMRTKWVRPEAELTFERPIGELGKFALFANGAWQKLYQADVPQANTPKDATAAGVGYGGRLEVGPFRLGVAGHYGVGLGTNYALEASGATSPSADLRYSDGYYVQTKVVAGPVDVFAGGGLVRVFLNDEDKVPDPVTGAFAHSVLKQEIGVNAGAVWHVKPWFHLDIDYFRAQFDWFLGEKQVVHTVSAGPTLNW